MCSREEEVIMPESKSIFFSSRTIDIYQLYSDKSDIGCEAVCYIY